MIIQQQHFNLNPFEFDIFAGMDVDKRSISVTFVSHEAVLRSIKIPYDSKNLMRYVEKQFPEKRIAFVYEAGPTGFGLYDDLVAADRVCLVVSPSQTPRTAAERIKTNRVDSRKLAMALRGGELRGIHVPSVACRQLRHLTHLREVFLHQVTSTKLRIKGMLLLEGIGFPADGNHRNQWSGEIIDRLKNLSLPEVLRFKLDQYLETLQFGKTHLLESTRQTACFCKKDPELRECMELLMTIPGIGSTVGFYLLSRIGDWRLLTHPSQVGALLGLVPTENSTGDRTRRGSISRMGDSVTRNKLIETSWTAIRHDPELKEFYERIRLRHPAPVAARKAIVAVARKLSTRIYAVLKYQRAYVIRITKSEPQAQGTTRG